MCVVVVWAWGVVVVWAVVGVVGRGVGWGVACVVAWLWGRCRAASTP